MSEIEFGTNEGKYIIVKAVVDSMREENLQKMVIKDSLEYGLRLSINNIS